MFDNDIHSAIKASEQNEKFIQMARYNQEKEQRKEIRQEELLSQVKKQNELLNKQIQDANERAIKAENSAKKSNIVAIISAAIAGCSFIVAIASLIVMLVK